MKVRKRINKYILLFFVKLNLSRPTKGRCFFFMKLLVISICIHYFWYILGKKETNALHDNTSMYSPHGTHLDYTIQYISYIQYIKRGDIQYIKRGDNIVAIPLSYSIITVVHVDIFSYEIIVDDRKFVLDSKSNLQLRDLLIPCDILTSLCTTIVTQIFHYMNEFSHPEK